MLAGRPDLVYLWLPEVQRGHGGPGSRRLCRSPSHLTFRGQVEVVLGPQSQQRLLSIPINFVMDDSSSFDFPLPSYHRQVQSLLGRV